MKRQRKGPAAKATRATSYNKKKAKVAATEVEERSPQPEGPVPTAEEVAEWASLWSGVDEEMSWATSWCPFWEMIEGSGDAYEALYDDVLWDFDIWGLKTIAAPASAPNP